MRRIIRDPSESFCPTGFIWVAYFVYNNTNKTNNNIFKVIYPQGTLKKNITDSLSETDLKLLHLVEVSI